MPAQDSHTSGKLLTTLPDLKLWAANEEGYLVGSEMMSEELHNLALEYLAEKKFCPDSDFVHSMDCYYKRNHCHIENRNGARFIRPSNCSKFMLKTGAAIVAEQRKPGNLMQKWLPTYHGTDTGNVASILRHGLVPAGTAVGSATTKTAHGSALGKGVYTSAIPLYAQLYARPELWRGYYVQTFFMLCQHPDTIDKFGTSGRSTASIIGRDDVWKLYGGFVAEDEVQYRTTDPTQFKLCALMIKIHRQDPRAPGGEFHEVASLLEQIDPLHGGNSPAASTPNAAVSKIAGVMPASSASSVVVGGASTEARSTRNHVNRSAALPLTNALQKVAQELVTPPEQTKPFTIHQDKEEHQRRKASLARCALNLRNKCLVGTGAIVGTAAIVGEASGFLPGLVRAVETIAPHMFWLVTTPFCDSDLGWLARLIQGGKSWLVMFLLASSLASFETETKGRASLGILELCAALALLTGLFAATQVACPFPTASASENVLLWLLLPLQVILAAPLCLVMHLIGKITLIAPTLWILMIMAVFIHAGLKEHHKPAFEALAREVSASESNSGKK